MRVYAREKYNDQMFILVNKNKYIDIDDVSISSLERILKFMTNNDCDIYFDYISNGDFNTLKNNAMFLITRYFKCNENNIRLVITNFDIYFYNIETEELVKSFKVDYRNVYIQNLIYICNVINTLYLTDVKENTEMFTYKQSLDYKLCKIYDQVLEDKFSIIMNYDNSISLYITQMIEMLESINKKTLFKMNVNIHFKYYNQIKVEVLSNIIKRLKLNYSVEELNSEQIGIIYDMINNIPTLKAIRINFKNGDSKKIYINLLDACFVESAFRLLGDKILLYID